MGIAKPDIAPVANLRARNEHPSHDDGSGAVSAVVTADGERVACELAVVGVGVAPRTELAERAGIAVTDGIVCDEFLQTSAPGVYAAGDVAAAHHPHYGRAIRRSARRAAAGERGRGVARGGA